GPAPASRRGRVDPATPQWAARPLHGPPGRDLQVCPTAEYAVPDRRRGRHPDTHSLVAVDERRGDRDPEPLPPILLSSPRIFRPQPGGIPMSVSQTRADRRAANPAAEVLAPRPPGQSDPIVLSCRTLRVWYGSSLALKDIAIDIPRNKITALIG